MSGNIGRWIVSIALVAGVAASLWAQEYRPTSEDAETLKMAESAFASREFARALGLLKPLAERGNARAQNGVGLIFDQGLGVPRDLAEAFTWYSRSAAQGYAIAQFNLGVMYAKGEAVAKDSAQAARWYQKAAEQGHAFAQHNLALLYAKGEGVDRDPVEAFRWEQRAAEQGDPNAQYNLAMSYATGTGIARDGDQAYRWFRSAAAKGYPLQLEFEPGWTVGAFRAEEASRQVVAEFIRQGDDIRDWKELFTVQILPLSAGRSPQTALDEMKALRERECPGTTTWHVIAGDERSILYEWQARPCLGWPDQHEIARILHVRGNAFILHYVVKSYRMPDDVRARWIAMLAAAR